MFTILNVWRYRGVDIPQLFSQVLNLYSYFQKIQITITIILGKELLFTILESVLSLLSFLVLFFSCISLCYISFVFNPNNYVFSNEVLREKEICTRSKRAKLSTKDSLTSPTSPTNRRRAGDYRLQSGIFGRSGYDSDLSFSKSNSMASSAISELLQKTKNWHWTQPRQSLAPKWSLSRREQIVEAVKRSILWNLSYQPRPQFSLNSLVTFHGRWHAFGRSCGRTRALVESPSAALILLVAKCLLLNEPYWTPRDKVLFCLKIWISIALHSKCCFNWHFFRTDIFQFTLI